jgi:endonuclease/exonuclease/phosphatase family metal-dependent hydrolase
MKILTFNIWNLFGTTNRRERMRAISEMFRQTAHSSDPWDIILLQEMWPYPDRRMFDRCGLPYIADPERPMQRLQNIFLAPAGALGFKWLMDSGMRVLSRYPITARKRLNFGTQFSWWERRMHPEQFVSKCAFATRTETPEIGSVWVVNTHLVAATRTQTQNRERWFQLEQLRHWIDTELIDAPIVLCGDLNMGPPIAGSHAASDEPEFWEKALAGPLSGFQVHENSVMDETWTAVENAYVKADAESEVARLDHILAGPGLAVRDARVVLRQDVDLGGGLRGPLSDHFGYEAVIAVQEDRV